MKPFPPNPPAFLAAFLAVCLLLPVRADASANDAFNALQALQGKWSIQAKGKTLATEMTYESASKGSIVTEQFGRELSVFYRDNGALLMTHFCNAGNQPRLRLTPTGDAHRLEFDMVDITNLPSPATSHVHKIVYRIMDNNKFALDIIWQTGPEEDTESYLLTRK